jgi:hypothetical protein
MIDAAMIGVGRWGKGIVEMLDMVGAFEAVIRSMAEGVPVQVR